MNGQPTTDQSFFQDSIRKYSPIEKLAFISLPFFLMLSVSILLVSPATIFEPPLLLPILNMIFLTIVPLFAVIAMLQDFVKNGLARNLFFACALLVFGLTSMVAGLAISLPTSPNPTVTIHNIGAFIAALLLCAAPSVQDSPGHWKTYTRRKGKAILAVLTIVSLTCVLSVLSMMDVLPPFFVGSKGPTTLRAIVLFAAVGLMFWASVLAYRTFRKEQSFFFYWKSIGLALIGIGLLVVLFQRGVGSPEGWIGRTAQYLGCIYLFYSTHVSFYEQSLLDSEKRYRLLAESTSDVVWQLDLLTNRYTYISPSIYRLRGYTPEEVMSQPLEVSLTSASLQNIQGWISQATEEFAQGRTDTIMPVREVEQTCKDGSTVWTEVSTAFVLDSDHRPIAINGLSRDITARIQAEEALRENEKRLSEIIDNTPAGYFFIDRAGCFQRVNNAWLRLHGYESPDEVIGRHFSLTQLETDKEDAHRNVEMLLTGGSIPSGEFSRRCRDGSVGYHTFSARPVIREGEILGFEGFLIDITRSKRIEEEKKFLEERLNRAERMESVGTLAGGVAHDLNNMLGALIGNAEILKMDMKNSDSSYNKVEGIMTAAQKAAKVVQDLLTMARRGVVFKDPASLNKIIADQLKSSEIRNLLSSHPYVEIETKYDRNLLDINASAIHIERVITNLISNSVRAISGHGTITIRTENRYLEVPLMGYEAVPKGEYAVLSVSDTGMGIFPEHMKNLFEPFYMRKTLKKGGSGLGLSVVWGALKDHDGYVDVTSEPGEWTIFSLYFPVTRDNIVKRVERSVEEYMGYGETILVIDDEDVQCSVAEKMLTRLNYVVKTVESGEEALEYLTDHDVDLILLDMIMEPGMDGYDTYRRILEIKKKQKAIIFSGFTKTERVKMAQDLGAGEFIMKPYIMEQLGIAVRKELDRKS